MKLNRISIALIVLSVLLIVGCASEAPPGGGPPDKTPPSLIDINIETGSTQVAVDQEILFYFDENLNPDNIRKSVTIFPLSDETPVVRVKGRALSVQPATQWDSSVVYSLILGKGVSDIRGNHLDQPIQISFTSGKVIPQNRISGKVLGLTSGTTAVIALSRKASKPDSIISFPEYYTQTGPDGEFLFEYLPAETFRIAGYVDMDKSNSYKDKFDGLCIPMDPAVMPDTAVTPLMMQAVYENFLPAFAIKAESLNPTRTDLTFSKALADWNPASCFHIGSLVPDTLMIDKNICRLYHEEIKTDTIKLSLSGLFDKVGLSIGDSSIYVPVTHWPDSFYHFEQIGPDLLITPDPVFNEIDAVLQSSPDTSDIKLIRRIAGFYELPQIKTARKGTCLIILPGRYEDIPDSLYSLSLEIPALPEFGSVIGMIGPESVANLHLVLNNDKNNYDITVSKPAFSFDLVVPGTYSLSYYIDTNQNGRRDLGMPFPHIKPELLLPLDNGIDVRARWDTELAEPYKIVVENGK